MKEAGVTVVAKVQAVFDEYDSFLHHEAMNILRNPEDAADCVQDALCNIMDYPGTFMRIEDDEGLKPYLLIVVRNAANKILKEHKEYNSRCLAMEEECSWMEDIPDSGALPIDIICELEAHEAFMKKIPTQFRDVVILHHYYRMRTADIASMLNMTVSNVRVRLYRATKYIREHRTEIFGERNDL